MVEDQKEIVVDLHLPGMEKKGEQHGVQQLERVDGEKEKNKDQIAGRKIQQVLQEGMKMMTEMEVPQEMRRMVTEIVVHLKEMVGVTEVHLQKKEIPGEIEGHQKRTEI